MADSPTPKSTVRDLKSEGSSGRAFSSILALKKVTTKTASNGKPFLSVELADKTGSFICTVFSDGPAYDALRSGAEGAVMRIEGKVETYQGRLSPKLTRALPLQPGEMTQAEVNAYIVEMPPEDPDALWAEFNAFAASIAQPGLRETVKNVIEDIGGAFRVAPAATHVHHAYRHGLLEHTVHMARVAHALLPLYREVEPSLAMAGILLHDIGKTIEYEGDIAPRKGRHGILQGHVVLGYQIARKAALRAKLDPELLELLEHVILSHQGKIEWGAAIMAATPEAVFVSMIDNLDARMGTVQRALRNGSATDEFTEKLLGLDGQYLLLKKPPGTP
jgi:3'-5' exoribonuclease